MKKLFGLLIIFSLLFSVSGALAGPDGPPNPIYLPVLMRGGGGGGQTSTVSGAIKDSGQFPIAGAVVKDIRGVTATSGLDGVYSMQVQPGPNTLTATRSGYSIDPQHINVVSGPNVVNFNAQVGCGNIVVNEQVTVGMGGWDFLTQHEDDVNPGTDTVIYQSAPSSGRIGVKLGVDANIPDTTRAISQPYHIPNESDADAVFLGVYVNEVNTGTTAERDRQYIDLVDADGKIHNLYTYNPFDPNQPPIGGWIYKEFPLDSFLGETVRIQFRVLNDGGTFYATMYFDDVSLVICNTRCDSQVVNGGFEARDGWLYNAEAIINPWYVNSLVVPPHSGFYSMQTGIPPLGSCSILTNQCYFDLESSSEVWQRNIELPSNQSGALLTFWIYRTRVEGVPPPGAPPADFNSTEYLPAMADPISRAPTSVTASPPEDWVYLYVLDDYGDVLAKPLWQRATNDNTWFRYRFDLSDYMGQQIELKFGTYNDGKGGPSAMFIDDVVVGTCD